MMKILQVLIVLMGLAWFASLYWLWGWTYDAFYPPLAEWDVALAKPWRPWARLLLAAILTMLTLGTMGYIAGRSRE